MPAVDYEKLAKKAEKNFFNDPEISQKNKELVKRINSKGEEEGFLVDYHVSIARKLIVLNHLRIFLKKTENIIEDMHDEKIMDGVYRKLYQEKKGYFETIKNVSKMFCTRLNDGVQPEGIRKVLMKYKRKDNKRKLNPDDMINWKDGLKMINATNSIQLKSVIATQLDGGFRPSEFIDLNYGDCKQKNDFIIVNVRDGKTGGRNVILWRAVPHLSRWLQNHPTKNKTDPLWLQENQTDGKIKKYDYYAVQKRIRGLGKKVKLDKPLDFYNLRHSACTISKLDNVPEEEAAKKFGHSLKYYAETYGRLSTEDSMSRLSKVYGLEAVEEEIEKNIKCSRCDFVNTPDAELCEKCGAALTVKKALEEQEKVNLKDKFILKIISGLMEKGKIDDAIKLVHDKDLEKELAKLIG